MAIGDDAANAGYPLVPETGDEGRVRWGAREINRTRDLIANVLKLIPVGWSGYRSATGISVGTSDPTSGQGQDNEIYLRIL